MRCRPSFSESTPRLLSPVLRWHRYVIAIADSLGDGELEQDEMAQAVATWQALLGDQEMIASRFDVYDKDKSGTLDKSQVMMVLKDLNGGVAVAEEEAEWVIESADGKGPMQLADGVLNKEVRDMPRPSFLLFCSLRISKGRRSGLIPGDLIAPSSVCVFKPTGAEGRCRRVVHGCQREEQGVICLYDPLN